MALLHSGFLNFSSSPPLSKKFNKDSNGALVNYCGKLRVPCKKGAHHYDHRNGHRTPVAEISRSIELDPAKLREVKRADFPLDFKFGGSSSAFQTEGDGTEGGRGPSTWDFKIGAGKKAADSYRLYKEDVKLLKLMGANAYRFSISWSRILPKGTIEGGINQAGIDFYNNLIDELLKNGITPVVTLFHFDLPQALQDAYSGLLDKKIVKDFQAYAELCFEKFGDRVKQWATINEPYIYAAIDDALISGNQYLGAHHMILCHASAAKAYQEKFQAIQGGKIGLSLSFTWLVPYSASREDKVATQKSVDFQIGWFMDPICYGDYPEIMKKEVNGLPVFTKEEKELVKGSYDWIGINYYTARYTTPGENWTLDIEKGHIRTQQVEERVDRNGIPIGPLAPGSDSTYLYPDGLRDALVYLNEKYKKPEIYITENGIPSNPDITMSIQEARDTGNETQIANALDDPFRIGHLILHLLAIRDARDKGANVKGYFAWSLLDGLEGTDTYDDRMGMNFTDYLDDYKRYQKRSSEWFYKFLEGKS